MPRYSRVPIVNANDPKFRAFAEIVLHPVALLLLRIDVKWAIVFDNHDRSICAIGHDEIKMAARVEIKFALGKKGTAFLNNVGEARF